MPGSNPSVVVPQLNHDLDSQQISESTLSAKSSPRNRLRPSRSGSSAVSAEGNRSVAPSYNNLDFLPVPEVIHDSETGFVDRFRSLVAQITRETEEALAFARSDDASSSQDTAGSSSRRDSPNSDQEDPHHQYNYHDDEDDFYAARALSEGDYNHRPYPADEQVRMMNAYVRRMPTIESMGSREMRSSVGASSLNTNLDRNRPPTRNTLVSWAGSDLSEGEPRSRPNSLSAQAELLANMFGKPHSSEIGELLQRETVRMVDSQSANEDSSETLGSRYSSSTSGSKGTVISYQTAVTSSTINSLTLALADPSGSPLSTPSNTPSSGESEPPVVAKQGDC